MKHLKGADLLKGLTKDGKVEIANSWLANQNQFIRYSEGKAIGLTPNQIGLHNNHTSHKIWEQQFNWRFSTAKTEAERTLFFKGLLRIWAR